MGRQPILPRKAVLKQELTAEQVEEQDNRLPVMPDTMTKAKAKEVKLLPPNYETAQ